MPTPASGRLTLSDVATEFGGSAPHKLSEYYGSGGVSSSGVLKLSDFYGKSNFQQMTINSGYQAHAKGDYNPPSNYRGYFIERTAFGTYAEGIPRRGSISSTQIGVTGLDIFELYSSSIDNAAHKTVILVKGLHAATLSNAVKGINIGGANRPVTWTQILAEDNVGVEVTKGDFTGFTFPTSGTVHFTFSD